ncbi:NAD(P)-dependent oxidoreductase [Sandaracinus amylolyticus]|uniref:Flavin reductase n=1 Tax=Sandaracinus amylolyticus TaxID=927083 RepID=A0A0F6VZD6_9BACT|nr:NAD(P)H-binding protein [Sandaracinus amylolyticus]AKF03512.1 Flavin reductase [Sandaracinus amylolyticus]
MNIVVIGASGRTGRHVVEQAIRRGHAVTAFGRRADVLAGSPGVRVVVGDGRDPRALRTALEGQDAVISIVAGEGLGPTRSASDVTRALVSAMRSASVSRLVTTSSRSVVATRPWLAVALAWLFFRHVYCDLVRQETLVEESGLDWTIVRATRLGDGAPRGRVHTDFEADATGGAWTLDRADYAMALLDAVADPRLVGRALGVSGPDRRSS